MGDVWRERAEEHRKQALDLLAQARLDNGDLAPGVARIEAQIHATLAKTCAALAGPVEDDEDEKASSWPHPRGR